MNEVCETLSPGSCSNGNACVRRPANVQRDCIRVPIGTKCPVAYPTAFSGFEGSAAGNCNCDCNSAGSSCEQPYMFADTVNQCSPAIPNVDSFSIPNLESVQLCTSSVTLPGTTASQLCCTN